MGTKLRARRSVLQSESRGRRKLWRPRSDRGGGGGSAVDVIVLVARIVVAIVVVASSVNYSS